MDSQTLRVGFVLNGYQPRRNVISITGLICSISDKPEQHVKLTLRNHLPFP